MSQSKNVVITGIGAVSPLGLDAPTTWAELVLGHSGIDFIKSFDSEGFETRFAAEVDGFNPEDYLDRKDARRMDRFAQFAVVAAQEACKQAGFDPKSMDQYRTGVIVGSGIGGIITLTQQQEVLSAKGPRRVTPFLIPMMLGDMASAQISMATGAMGVNFCVVSSCSSGADALGQGWEMIRRGQVDVVLAGGSEAPITPLAVAGFNSCRALSRFNEDPKRASRPFNRDRDGFVMGEGSAILVLESEEHAKQRGATPLARLQGYGATSDAYHLTEPGPTGQSAATAVLMALKAAGVDPSEIDYLNAHGTSTPMNDRQETKALKLALGEEAYRVPISSTKSMTGHLLGAGGALEAAICVMAIQDGIMPPTANLVDPDPECDLDYTPLKARQQEINVCVSDSFGFGGHNSVLVFTKPDWEH
ncbi:MAG: beta-ketoacyl-ACP synthase II [Chloroflexi bacterium]|nr:beta-ketoacyl-ACP synthase II [Chloroflexota bacterium]MDA1218292.1 beta-ketoacyl-ACP synthase II [Chloroflexota bacterium]PKB56938.1 MAG: beta-ketoacyl-[acyl-carrier-protein] synthase II [SAR202 cluster bacterium Casp-Chloro-G3]